MTKRKIRKLLGADKEQKAACKFCGTYLVAEGEELTCPQCGYVAGTESHVFKVSGKDEARKEPRDTPAISVLAQEALDPVDENETEPEGRVGLEEDKEERGAAVENQARLEVGTPAFTSGPRGIQELLVRQPQVLESGLRLVTDKRGKSVGPKLSTPLGPIDLLFRDGNGALVVVTIAKGAEGEDDLVVETLRRMGWVRKQLGQEKVRGIILMGEVPGNLGYTAAAMAGTIAIKTYRIGVTFEDVEI